MVKNKLKISPSGARAFNKNRFWTYVLSYSAPPPVFSFHFFIPSPSPGMSMAGPFLTLTRCMDPGVQSETGLLQWRLYPCSWPLLQVGQDINKRNIEIVQQLCPEGVWGPRSRNKNGKNVWGLWPCTFVSPLLCNLGPQTISGHNFGTILILFIICTVPGMD